MKVVKHFILPLFLIIGGCSSKMNVKEESSPDLSTEVSFTEGSSRLTQEAEEKIRQLFLEASKENVEIKEVKLISWADRNYLSEGKQLPEWQQKLAHKRNDALERELKDLDQTLDFNKISMAESNESVESLKSKSKNFYSIVIFVLED